MRIGFFSDSYFPEFDGVTYTLKAWKERLEERGHEVYIIYPESEEYEPQENEIPVRSVSNPFYSGYNIPVPVFRDEYPDLDVVHCHSPATLGISGLRFARKNDVPAIYTHHTPIEEYFEQSVHSKKISAGLEKIYVPLENFFLEKFDVLTASTPEPRRPVDFRQLPVGIDMQFFRPSEEKFFDEEDVERPVAGYSGRISMEKNPCELVEMAEKFDGTVVVVGEGPLKDKLVEKAPQNVVFHDFLEREDLPKFYSDIDVFVTASTGDTLGLSTLEANACGTPVVAPDAIPFENTIESENGILYDSGDVEAFKNKAEKASEKSFDTRSAVEEYSLSKTIDELEEIYEDKKDASR
ncbi:glycosyltransferase [Candidatus Nanosalina sp. VS9-1]|uniref:glycosyltransferase n=1 Tax=Candidatus Nanosalina sp. VS9-1 TaxID=3388566 RepID=UPI0039E0DACB